MTDRVQRVMRQLLQRVRGISANFLPGDPIPAPIREGSTADFLPGDPIPVTTP